MTQGGEDLGVCVDEARRHRVAVDGAVRVSEDESPVVLALDEQLAAMDGTVMRSTQRQEVRDLDRVLQAEAPDTVSSFSEASTSA